MSKQIPGYGFSEDFLKAHVGHLGDECLLWPAGGNDKGYGLATVGGVQRTASNWMCRLAHGEPTPPRVSAAHNCGNPACVNPRHLRWATQKENAADRSIHGTENRGENNGRTRLTAEDVRAIRAAPPALTPLMLKYGMTKHGISKVRSGKRWAHVQ